MNPRTKLATSMICLALIAFLLVAQFGGVKAATSVTNLNDSGPGSLRQAIADAAPGATITFAVSGMITLTGGELLIAKDLTLSGPGAANLSISGNKANIAQASRVIHNRAHLAISGLTIRDGEAGAGAGGGILNDGAGVLTISDSVVMNSQAQRGGGIFNSAGGSLQVTNSTLSGNLTRLVDVGLDASGAGIYNAAPGGVANIQSSTFSANVVHDNGGGLYNEATATVVDSTFSLNQAGTAAVYNSGALQLNNVTVTLNNGRKQATGLLTVAGSVGLANSIIAGNTTSGNNSLPDCGGVIASSGHNLIGDATGCVLSAGAGDQLGSSVTPIDARLGPLANNGGPTSTHSPLAGSPVIDTGSTDLPGSGGTACEATDQRGAARPQNGNGTLRCDIGAVELGVVGLPTPTSTPVPVGTPTSTPTPINTPPPGQTPTSTPTSTPTGVGTPAATPISTPAATVLPAGTPGAARLLLPFVQRP